MSDSKDKRRTVERFLKGAKHQRSREEEQQLARQAQARRAGRRGRSRSQEDWSEYDEEEPFETFEAIPQVDGRPEVARGAGAPSALNLPHPWLVVDTGPQSVQVAKREGWGGRPPRPVHLGGTALPQGRPVVGDLARLEELPSGEARLRSIAQRRTWLERRDPGRAQRAKTLAVNVDVALLVTTPGPDGLRLALLDRLRIAVTQGGIVPLVVLNKLDLAEGADLQRVERQLAELAEDGLEVFATCALDGRGVEALRARLAGTLAVAVGPSGAGKSTLLNALDPEHQRATGAVREDDLRGRHTTTAAAMHPFGDGGWLIDTPGIREFGLVHLTAEELLEAFPRLAQAAEGCPRACDHRADPACALAAAAAAEPRVAREYKSLLRLLDDLPE